MSRASRTSRPTSAAATPTTTAPRGATPSRAGWRGSSRPTPSSARSCSPSGARGTRSDGAGGELDSDLRWQAELWRRLLDVVDAPPPDVRHDATVARLRAGGADLDLPPRLSLFGHTRLPETEVSLLAALGELRDVHLWLPQASTALWDALAPLAREGQVPRAADTSAAVVGHPLLSSLGRDARELRRTLGDLPSSPRPRHLRPRDTLLGWLQHDLRANHAPSAAERAGRTWTVRATTRCRCTPATARPGRSTCCARCWSGCSQRRPDQEPLEPRDILVMVPDIETYAPLISAAFGMADVAGEGAGHPGHQLRVRLADRSLAATNPLLALAAQLVELVRGRMTASQVLDVAGADPVRARFGFGDDEIERISHWVDVSGVRWGYDAQHRDTFGLGGLDANTWVSGLRRVLLGAAMSGLDHRQVVRHGPGRRRQRRRPRAGRPVRRARRARPHLRRRAPSGPRPSPTGRRGVRGRARPHVHPADGGLAGRAVRPRGGADRRRRRRHGHHAAAGRRTSPPAAAAARSTHPRQLPHRHADGLHDGADALGAAPRGVPGRSRRRRLPAGLDRRRRRRARPATAHRRARPARRGPAALPRRDRRGDRQARHHLHRPRRAHRRRATAGRAARRAARRARPHDGASRCATTSSPTTRCSPSTRPTSSPGGCARTAPSPSTGSPWPARARRGATGQPVGVLVPAAAAGAPTRRPATSRSPTCRTSSPTRSAGFFRRLRIARPYDADEVKDAIPITLDALEKWAVGDRLASEVLGGADAIAVGEALKVSGQLPPGPLGKGVLDEIITVVRPLVIRGLELRRGPQRSLDVDIDARRRPPALRHGRRRVGQQRRVGLLLQPRRQAPARRLDQRARPRRRPPRRELDRAHHRQAPLRRPGPADRHRWPSTRPSSGCATSSPSTTPASASRSRCR